MEILQADKLRAMLNEESTDDQKPTTGETTETKSKVPKTDADVRKMNKLEDTSPVTAFLQGKNCLTGVSCQIRQFLWQIFYSEFSIYLGHWMVEI